MLVELRNVRAARGTGRARREVLHDVGLLVPEGEICGLLGPNGAGKSTTIAVITGLLPATGGLVRLFGALEPGDDLAPHYGVLPEQNGCYEWMTAADYLDFFLRLHGRRLVPADIVARLRQVGLEAVARQPIRSFSRGMRQRLGLARALVNDPSLLLLDEPTAGLDPRGRRDVHDLLIHLSRTRGVGVLLSTHLLDDVDRLCQRVAIISEGRTLCEGRVADLLAANAAGQRYRLRLQGGVPVSPAPPGITLRAREGEQYVVDLDPGLSPVAAWRLLLRCGWPVEEIRAEASSLEALYFDITEARAAA
jgi:ABC-2 type transport system ATP-binding protein